MSARRSNPARRPTGRSAAALVLFAALATSALTAARGESELFRVGTSGDYPPFSLAASDASEGSGNEVAREGFDVAVARAFAAERGLRIRWVSFAWPELVDDLLAGDFDAAMGGITVRPERSLAGRFSVPVTTSGAVLIAPQAAGASDLAHFDRPSVRIAVNAGGHLERVARAHLPNAEILAIAHNSAVRAALIAGEVAAVVTDTREAPLWLAGIRGFRQIGPFTRDRKAYLLQAAKLDLARSLDAWLLAREDDGTLAALRQEYLGAAGAPSAAPLPALLAAIDERLALMPLVAEAKRATGRAIEDRVREARVVEAGLAGVREAAESAGRPPPADTAVRALYRSLIEAAKAVQRAVLEGSPHSDGADLEREIRPALLRIGEKIAWLAVRLPTGLSRADVEGAARDSIAAPGIGADELEAMAAAIARLSSDRSARGHAE